MGNLSDLHGRLGRAARGIGKSRREALRAFGKGWRHIVRQTVWTGKRPSPDGLIITEMQGDSSIDIGWRNYPSGDQRAFERFRLRRPFIDRLIERIRREMAQSIKRSLGGR